MRCTKILARRGEVKACMWATLVAVFEIQNERMPLPAMNTFPLGRDAARSRTCIKSVCWELCDVPTPGKKWMMPVSSGVGQNEGRLHRKRFFAAPHPADTLLAAHASSTNFSNHVACTWTMDRCIPTITRLSSLLLPRSFLSTVASSP